MISQRIDKVIKSGSDLNKELHPHQLLVYLAMFGSAVLFLFILIAYFATRSNDEAIHLSRFFAFSTALLLFSTYPIGRLYDAFGQERGIQIIKGLATAAFAGAIFILLQVVGWYDMQSDGMTISQRGNGFLYVLSGLHLLHVVGMVVFTAVFMYVTAKKLSDPIATLIYYTNPYERLKLKMLTQTWFFLHGIWLAIYFTFLALN